MGKVWFFSGRPGSGKDGAIRAILALGLNVQVLSMSSYIKKLLTELEVKDPESCLKIRTEMAAGKLVPDDIVIPAFEAALKDAVASGSGDIIVNGFPRSSNQKVATVKLIKTLSVEAELVHFDIPRDVCWERIVFGRAKKENRQDDRNPDVVEFRFEVYDKETAPAIASLARSVPAFMIQNWRLSEGEVGKILHDHLSGVIA